MNKPRFPKAAVFALLSTAMVLAQERNPVSFDPVTGLPIMAAQILPEETGLPATAKNETGITAPVATAYDPLTGLPVAATSTATRQFTLDRGPGNLSIIGLATNDARKSHASGQWLLAGGMANIGALMFGGIAGGVVTSSPMGVLLGSVAGVYLVTRTLSRVTGPIAVPVVLKDVSASKQNIYKDSYRLRTQALRKGSAYLGTILVGGSLMMVMALL
ncbi:MAG: hypothetical protein IIA59_01425 [Candidatus Marinimicrobia bacterium]|nr:hypothetical protein [Candidatus Neomarinimicrobiota bacterium]